MFVIIINVYWYRLIFCNLLCCGAQWLFIWQGPLESAEPLFGHISPFFCHKQERNECVEKQVSLFEIKGGLERHFSPYSDLIRSTWQTKRKKNLQTAIWSTGDVLPKYLSSDSYESEEQGLLDLDVWKFVIFNSHLVLVCWYKSLKRVSDLQKSS